MDKVKELLCQPCYAAAAGFFGLILLTRVAKLVLRKRLSPLSYAGKVVIVTGASSGIGEQLALLYAKLGADVCLAARRIDMLKDVASRCRLLQAQGSKGGSHRPGEVLPLQADISTEEGCKKLINAVVAQMGKIDLLVLNAGKGGMQVPFEKADIAKFRYMMDVNYWGPVWLTQFALPHVEKTKGTIAAVSSLNGKYGTPYRTDYCPTKHALQGFFDSLRYELKDVTLCLISPGYVITEIHNEMLDKKGAQRNLSKFMTAEECARETADAIINKERDHVMTFMGRLGLKMRPFMPDFILDRMIWKSSTAAFSFDPKAE